MRYNDDNNNNTNEYNIKLVSSYINERIDFHKLISRI